MGVVSYMPLSCCVIFAIYSKKLEATHTWKFLTFPNTFVVNASINKKNIWPPPRALWFWVGKIARALEV